MDQTGRSLTAFKIYKDFIEGAGSLIEAVIHIQ